MRRNVAGQFVGIQLIAKADGTPVTTGTTTVYVTGDAGTQGAGSVGSGACTHEGNGFWTYAPAQAETNYTHVAFTFVNTSAVNATLQIYPTQYDASGYYNISSGTGTGQLSLSSGLVTLAGVTHTGAVIPTVTTTTTATNLTNERSKYTHGAVWIGSVANTNTTNYTDGILTNPVSTIAAAKSIADSLGLKRFWVQSGVTIALLADMDGYVFDGFNYNFNTSGGTRSISGTVVRNCFVGTAASVFSGASPPYFDNCEFGTATVTLPAANLNHCEVNTGVITFGTGNTDLIDCSSVVAGTSTPVFTIPVGTVNVSFRRWSGGITIDGITSGTTISIDVVSGGTVTLNGADGTVNVRGMVNAITDNRTGTPTLGRLAALNQTFLATPTNITAGTITTVSGNVNGSVASVTAEVTANVTKISGSTAAADNLEESTEAIAFGTVDGTGATTTVFLTSALTPDAAVADQFKGRVLIFKSDTTTANLRGQATTISSHTFTSAEVITLTVVALTTAPSSGDTFVIL